MGWTNCHVNYYKNEKVNKKKECDSNSINKLPEISFTKDELIVLEKYLACNPCETKINCKVKLPIVNGKGDCNAKDKNGKYICPFMNITKSILNKLCIDKEK